MKQLIGRQGKLSVEEVPSPSVQPGTILVQTLFSCISSGTELSQLHKQGEPLWRKALNKPQQVKKALDMMRTEGVQQTLSSIDQKLKAPTVSGYSLSGRVLEVGAGVSEFQVGDLVACAGSQCANHAELACVPVNLAVKTSAPPAEASTVALGAIALQGVRRLNPTLGETFMVTGLGILGQITVQLLKAAGCKVIAVDLNPQRLKWAEESGADLVIPGDSADLPQKAQLATAGVGVDGVIITASSASSGPLSLAFQACRKKGRVVLVGELPIEINRAEIYEKEIDFLISTSYGPGRYDQKFEEAGVDYPVAYVRWTETRNMEAYLSLLSEGKIGISSFLKERFPLENATKAFDSISANGLLTALLEYDGGVDPRAVKSVQIRPAATADKSRIGLGIVGAGSFTRAVHAPILKAIGDKVDVKTVVSRQGYRAKEAAEILGAQNASTDFEAILRDDQVQAVLLATRHNLHAGFALKALRSGKHVFVEKPTAIDRGELASLREFFAGKNTGPILFTGFNRRYSEAAVAAKAYFSARKSPLVIQYTMNAGFLPKDHWVHGPEGGGRNIGEACHAYDFFLFLTGASRLPRISAQAIRAEGSAFLKNDNFSANFQFADGSIANFLYTSNGNAGLPKEEVTIFCENRVFRIQDFKKFHAVTAKGPGQPTENSSKGHKEEWDAFLQILRGKPASWDLESQFLATEMSLVVEEQIFRE